MLNERELTAPISVTALTNADGSASIDVGHEEDGYVTVTYTGPSSEARAEILLPDGTVIPYPLKPGKQTVCGLVSGSAIYRIIVLESDGTGNYAVIFEDTIESAMTDELAPFLTPNLYVSYGEDSACVKEAAALYEEAGGDVSVFVRKVYEFVTESIAYDEELAADLPLDYIPDPDRTLKRGRGICYDYAALMTAMLRSAGIPARMNIGYFGAYSHAWVSAVPIRPSKGTDYVWVSYDPTLRANNDHKEVAKRLTSGAEYLYQYAY